ncbi:MAG: histidine kinase [Candidatus Thiodiazotropha sp.]
MNDYTTTDSAIDKYKLARRYGITSSLAITATAVFMLLFFRYETIKIIEDASKRSTETLTLATEFALNDHFVMFLHVVDQNKDKNLDAIPLEPFTERIIQKMLDNTNVVRLKIYNKTGRVVYSTKREQIGDGQEDNDGFRTAMSGAVKTILVYRDTFNFLDKEVEDANLVQTYTPIRANDTSPVLGVMEIYSDINEYVVASNTTIIILVSITVLLMFFLFSFLLLHVKKSERIIEEQNSVTREKKRLLEFLTAKMITAQEDEKKRIAFALHEDVVQTLSGVKMQLEKYILTLDTLDSEESSKQLSQEIIPILQNAAYKIRSVAIDLRPPSLDDFGLTAAVNSLISECHTTTSGLEIKIENSVDDKTISADLKAIIYRMMKDTLKSICFDERITGSCYLDLHKEDNNLVLIVTLDSEFNMKRDKQSLPQYFNSMQDRSILSGGDFYILSNSKDRIKVKSIWH